MIISIHVPKTGGTTFRNFLLKAFPSRVYFDYSNNEKVKLKIPDKTEILHGHITAYKYRNVYPNAKYITWLREPTQIPISMYYHYLRNPDFNSYLCQQLYNKNLSLEGFINLRKKWNVINDFIGDVPLEAFSFIGILEDYDKSIERFIKQFNISDNLIIKKVNYNPDRSENKYDVSDELKAQLKLACSESIVVYQKALALIENNQ